jgi:hypothetical protein
MALSFKDRIDWHASIDPTCMYERLLIQQYLDAGLTEEALSTQYGITARHGVRYPNLVSLKYDMVDVAGLGTSGHPLVRECRGIVLDTADNFRIVSRGFNRFYNVGDPLADEIDWSKAKVLTKEDGSLILASWYKGEWLISSSGSPEASGEVNGFGLSFADYFWQTLDENSYELPDHDCGVTLIFEIVGAINRIVVEHEKADLVLLGARDLRTQVELTAEDAASLYVPTARVVKSHPLRTPAEIATALAALEPSKGEGFVVLSTEHDACGNFRRQKNKTEAYIRWHAAKDACTPRSLTDIARKGESDEIIAAFPELRARLADIRQRIDEWVAQVQADYEGLKNIRSQKEFAQQAVLTRCSSALFQIRSGKARSARDYLTQAHLDRVCEWLGVRTSGLASPSAAP